MSELNIKSTLKDSNQFILQVSDIPGTVKKYPVKVTATLDNGSKVEQTKYITIKVSPTVSISGADKFTAQFGEGTAHYDFSYTPAKYNAPITVASVKSSNSSVTVSGISTSGFDLSVTGLTDSTTTTITATLLVDKTTVSLTKNITVEYQEDTSPFILYNVGESADVGIHKGGSIEMTKMYFKVVDDYTEGEEYDDSAVDYEIWENTSTNNTKTVATVGKNQALLLKAYKKNRWNTGPDSSYYSYFVLGSSGKFKAYGKIGALDGYYTKLGNGCYNRIFYDCKSLIKAPELPATTLGSYCYNYMFSGCTGLTTLPENLLPATTLISGCYNSMFYKCTGLTTVPENLLPATTLASNCYQDMFLGCTGLTEIPENLLPATTLASNCYAGMFYKCTGLTTLPENLLPATTLEYGCYVGMFFGCTGLTEIPENMLPATTLAEQCYGRQVSYYMAPCGMFQGCTGLTTLPENLLPATTLANYCYEAMFSGCTGLTTLPKNLLPATTLAESCYGGIAAWSASSGMFYGCTSLTQAPELPATTLANSCYNDMFRGCTSLTQAPELPATTLANSCYQSMFYGCKGLTELPENLLPATTLVSNCYYYMFTGCTGLTTLPENLLPATTLGSYCYYSMFQSCKGLTEIPENLLPATTLASNCYDSMFSNCESLIKAPELPATTLAGQCYQNMFYGCTKLSYVKALFTTTPGSGYTSSWLYSVASAGTFIGNLAASWDVTGTSGVPTGWTHYNTITLSKPSIKANSDGTGSGHVTITSLLEPNSTASISLTKVEAPTSSDGCSLSFSNLSSTGFDVTVSGFTQDVIFTLTATLSVNGETVTKTTTFTVVKYVFVDGDEHFTLETSSSPAFTVASAATTNLNTYMAKVGGYLLYPKDNKVYATKLKADDWNYFSDGTDATSYVPKCETMIYLPKCHYASYGKKFIFGGLSTDYGTVFESPEWVGAYEMYVDSSGTGHSRPDQSPTRSKTIGAFWNCAQGLGTDWGLANYEFFCLINALYQTKYGNLDSQTQVGTGGTTSSYSSWMDVKMGYGRTLGDGSGSASTSMSGQNCVKLFGFEDLWAKCWEWRQGIWLSNSKIHVYNSNKVSSTESDREWDAVLKGSGSYISSCFLGENGHWDMLPKAVSGASNSYYCDYGYMSSSSGPLALYVGGPSGDGSCCGVSCSYLIFDFSYSRSIISSRLSFYGTPEIVDATTFKSYLQ